MDSYHTSLEILAPRASVFRAISQKLSDWWGQQDVPVDQAGLIFKVSWGEPWYQFEVKEYQPPQNMVWECIDANQKISGLEGVEKEWVGTRIHWELQALDPARTHLEFQHEGLVPDFLCFDFCSQTWEHFLKEELVGYLAVK